MSETAPDSAQAEPQLIDLHHLGRARVIGAWRVGEVIVDPGPASCLERLLAALGPSPPRVLALTHIHLDHAGATGSLLRLFGDAEVWVHERGAPHLVDPSRLLASATRLYGAEMARLWGEVLPVPAERVRVLRGGERLGAFSTAYTPGHAVHHVAYLHEPTGTAFTGDVAGVRVGPGPVLAPTPPPDIDLEAWRASLATIASWRPRQLAPGHFGVHRDVDTHLAAVGASLERVAALAAERDEAGFLAGFEQLLADVPADLAAVYRQAVPPAQSYRGLRRYLESQAPGSAGVRAG
jgi:glyoxylase-like metal-dependent hydrolase (beta-lactamase superfamily II)